MKTPCVKYLNTGRLSECAAAGSWQHRHCPYGSDVLPPWQNLVLQPGLEARSSLAALLRSTIVSDADADADLGTTPATLVAEQSREMAKAAHSGCCSDSEESYDLPVRLAHSASASASASLLARTAHQALR